MYRHHNLNHPKPTWKPSWVRVPSRSTFLRYALLVMVGLTPITVVVLASEYVLVFVAALWVALFFHYIARHV